MNGIFISAKSNRTNKVEYLAKASTFRETIMIDDIDMALGFTSKEEAVHWFNRFLRGNDFIKGNFHDFAIVTVIRESILT